MKFKIFFSKIFPNEVLEKILILFKHLWIEGEYPPEFIKSLLNPILNPGKDPNDKKSYRFTSRITCIGNN